MELHLSMSLALYLAVGIAVGLTYFALLLRTARLYATGGTAATIMVAYVVRLGLAAVVFWLVAQQGSALALLTALFGFLAARATVMRWVRRS